MNVAMNIADKAAFYGEIHRVLRPGGWLVLSEAAQGPEGPPDYPTPWARTAESSFLATPEETRAGLAAAGFTVSALRDAIAQYQEFGARSRAAVERGEKPPHRAVMLVHGEIAADAARNTARGITKGQLIPIEVSCVKAVGE
jgi:SAM-dependent methyltransferase